MNVGLVTYGSLGLAIVLETIGTSFLKESEQFSRLLPSLVCIASYAASFFMLSVVLRHMPVGIAYAVWCGLGIVLISIIGVVAFKQHLDLPAYIGLGLILAGVIVVNVFSKAAAH